MSANGESEKSDGRCFAEPSQRTDVELLVEGKSFHVSKLIMAEISPVFDQMFFGEYKERDQKRVELPGKTYTSMLEFLRCVYPPSAMTVKEDHVLFLVPLANEYQVQVLLKKCETVALNMVKRVTGTSKPGHEFVMTLLLLAETHGLDELKDACLEKSVLFQSSKVEGTEAYKELNDDVKFLLLQRRVRHLQPV